MMSDATENMIGNNRTMPNIKQEIDNPTTPTQNYQVCSPTTTLQHQEVIEIEEEKINLVIILYIYILTERDKS